ncbi:MAG: hypothetical protein GF332_03360 [Candidatus Moranbacteria bacterium]|nr:hypothetical protein [Candidatus Moranbacteria bacterium]
MFGLNKKKDKDQKNKQNQADNRGQNGEQKEEPLVLRLQENDDKNNKKQENKGEEEKKNKGPIILDPVPDKQEKTGDDKGSGKTEKQANKEQDGGIKQKTEIQQKAGSKINSQSTVQPRGNEKKEKKPEQATTIQSSKPGNQQNNTIDIQGINLQKIDNSEATNQKKVFDQAETTVSAPKSQAGETKPARDQSSQPRTEQKPMDIKTTPKPGDQSKAVKTGQASQAQANQTMSSVQTKDLDIKPSKKQTQPNSGLNAQTEVAGPIDDLEVDKSKLGRPASENQAKVQQNQSQDLRSRLETGTSTTQSPAAAASQPVSSQQQEAQKQRTIQEGTVVQLANNLINAYTEIENENEKPNEMKRLEYEYSIFKNIVLEKFQKLAQLIREVGGTEKAMNLFQDQQRRKIAMIEAYQIIPFLDNMISKAQGLNYDLVKLERVKTDVEAFARAMGE